MRISDWSSDVCSSDLELREGDILTLDGSTGEVMAGEVPPLLPELVGDVGTLMAWADKVRRMKVRTNAETPQDAQVARDFGAEGIGLCRTEHMFFDAARITAVREMILADSEDGRRAALAKLLPEQRGDFAAIFGVMAGLPGIGSATRRERVCQSVEISVVAVSLNKK